MGIKDIPKKMRACRVKEFNKPYVIEEIDSPSELKPNDILVKIAVASLCHTDFMVCEGIMGTKLPCIASHEGTGTIVAVGDEAAKKFKEGDRVMNGIFRDFCGVCEDCQGPERFQQYCGDGRGAMGVHIDGNFAEYVIADSRTSCKLPDNVSYETAAPLACAGITVWRGILQSGAKKGDWLVLVGSGGGLGHLGVKFAKALGIQVIGIDARDGGLKLTKEAGADLVVDAREGNDKVVEQVHAVTNGEGVAATVNISDAKSAAATACAVTKKHGKVIQIAQPDTVDIPFAELVFRDIHIEGSLIASPDEAERMLDLVSKNNISVQTNIFDNMDAIPDLVKLAESGNMVGKGIVRIDHEQVEAQKKLASTLA